MSSRWDQITEDQYAIWKHHPVSLAMFQYYRDYVSVLQRELIERWKSGALLSQDEQEMRGRVNTLEEIVDQPYEVMKTFYAYPEANEDYDAA